VARRGQTEYSSAGAEADQEPGLCSFPSDEALTRLFYLALRNISQKWTMPIRDWKAALT